MTEKDRVQEQAEETAPAEQADRTDQAERTGRQERSEQEQEQPAELTGAPGYVVQGNGAFARSDRPAGAGADPDPALGADADLDAAPDTDVETGADAEGDARDEPVTHAATEPVPVVEPVRGESSSAPGPRPGPRPGSGSGSGPASGPGPEDATGIDRSPVLDPQVAQRLRDDWQQVQYDFVDDPRQAVERADAVVARAGQRIAEALLARNAEVRQSWQSDGPGSAAQDTGTSTEQLRVVLQRYRDVLDRVIEL